MQAISQVLHTAYSNEVIQRGKEKITPIKELEDVARWLHISTLKPWLIIYGSVGNGKTTTARAVISLYQTLRNVAIDKLKDRWQLKQQGDEILSLYEHIATIHIPQMFSAQDISSFASNDQEQFDKVKGCPFLVIDDIGIEPTRVLNYGTEISPIAEVLYYRYERNMMTILTTNKDFEQLSATYGERISDRLKEVASRIGYKSSSYR